MLKAKRVFSGNLKRDILDSKGIAPELIYQNDLEYVPKNIDKLREFMLWNTNIVIFADCDTDGLSAAAICKVYLEQLPDTKLHFKISKRDRRGFQLEDAKEIVEEFPGVDGVLTVDCGIGSVKATQYLLDNDIDVFITDHHRAGHVLPNAPIINPHLEEGDQFNEVCGAGLIYLALRELYEENDCALQYAAIATVADLVPLIADNRVIVKHGLERITTGNTCESIESFVKNIGTMLYTEKDIGWGIAPVINSASRLNKEQIALDAYVRGDYNAAIALKNLNKERKKIVKKLLTTYADRITIGSHSVSAIIETEYTGLVGLIATQLTNLYGLPALVASYSDDSNYRYSLRGKGSGEFISYMKERYGALGGGHAMAGGFSSEQNCKNVITDFHEWHEAHAENEEEATKEEVIADIEIPFYQIAMRDIDKSELGPYGEGFSEPLFLSQIYLRYEGKTSSGKYDKYTVSCVERENYTATFVDFNNLIGFEINSKDNYIFNAIYSVNYNIFYRGLEVSILSLERKDT